MSENIIIEIMNSNEEGTLFSECIGWNIFHGNFYREFEKKDGKIFVSIYSDAHPKRELKAEFINNRTDSEKAFGLFKTLFEVTELTSSSPMPALKKAFRGTKAKINGKLY
jgi:hypothetical protein